MSVPPTIETLVLQPTPFCNIGCTYCYPPNRRDRSVMSRATLQAAFDRVFASGCARFCELTRMVPADLILAALERLDPAPLPTTAATPTARSTQCLTNAA